MTYGDRARHPRGAFALWLAAAVAAGATVACTSATPGANVPAHAPGARTVYVAVGASDALGFGTNDPIRQAWPQVFFTTALPPGATFVNLAVAGSTVRDALQQQVPYVGDLRPTVITVFLGVNDLRAGVTPVEYGARLRALLSDLRADGAPTVLVANVPPLDRLPAYLACRPNPPPGGPPCSTAGALPPPDELNARVAAYDRAVADAAAATGAALVDLYLLGLTARADGTEASTVSSDGFHPNARGHALIARAFAGAYRRVAPPVSP